MSALEFLIEGVDPAEADIADALGMSDAEFNDTVIDALRRGDEDDWHVLLARPVRARTLRAMTAVRLAVEAQLRAMPVGARRDAVKDDWKVIRRESDRRASQAEWLKKREHEEHQRQIALSSTQRNAVRLLALAINRHMGQTLAADLSPEPHDLALWAVLREIRVPIQKRAAGLVELIQDGTWNDGDALDESIARHDRKLQALLGSGGEAAREAPPNAVDDLRSGS